MELTTADLALIQQALEDAAGEYRKAKLDGPLKMHLDLIAKIEEEFTRRGVKEFPAEAKAHG
jgi:hypothetical protein